MSQSQGELRCLLYLLNRLDNAVIAEEFPEIRDLLRPYTRKNTGTAGSSAVATVTTALPVHLARLSIRATTFDGKAVYIGKKPRKFTSLTTVSPSAIVCTHDLSEVICPGKRCINEDRQPSRNTCTSTAGRHLIASRKQARDPVRPLRYSVYASQLTLLQRCTA